MVSNLLKKVKAKGLTIEGMAIDSHNVKKNFIFFAIPGSKDDGNKYIKEVLKKNPAAIVTTQNKKYKSKVPFFFVKNIRKELALFSYNYHQIAIANKIAITGTNGKTSVAFYVQYILTKLGNKCGSIGTLGSNFKQIQSNLTTPDSIQIAQLLNKFTLNKYNSIVMEASSHALDQNRVFGLDYKILALTNISHDHLDYHKNINNYINAKLKLFINNKNKNEAINIISKDTKYYNLIKNKLKKNKINFKTFGFKISDYQIMKFDRMSEKINTKLKHLKKTYTFKFNNLPEFQVQNFLLAATMVAEMGYELKKISKLSLAAPNVPGRMELAGVKKNKAKIYIDFAHTPDALKNVLQETKLMNPNKLHIVFGCGGDRDKNKRQVMGKIATKYADLVVVTDDNPRNENASKIRSEIINKSNNIFEIPNREEAIKHAISNLKSNDILIIAGKGHEKYQIIKDKTISFDDAKIAKKYIK